MAQKCGAIGPRSPNKEWADLGFEPTSVWLWGLGSEPRCCAALSGTEGPGDQVLKQCVYLAGHGKVTTIEGQTKLLESPQD